MLDVTEAAEILKEFDAIVEEDGSYLYSSTISKKEYTRNYTVVINSGTCRRIEIHTKKELRSKAEWFIEETTKYKFCNELADEIRKVLDKNNIKHTSKGHDRDPNIECTIPAVKFVINAEPHIKDNSSSLKLDLNDPEFPDSDTLLKYFKKLRMTRLKKRLIDCERKLKTAQEYLDKTKDSIERTIEAKDLISFKHLSATDRL